MGSTRFVKIIFSILLLVSANNLFAQKTDRQRDNLKGRVKSISFYTNSRLVKTRTYNLNGFETSLTAYCADYVSRICAHDSSVYDSHQNMIKYEDEFYVTEKTYNSTNNLIESITRNKPNKTIADRIKYTYVGSKKTRSEQIQNSINGNVINFTVVINYNYDLDGKLITEDNALATHSAAIRKKTIYKYDAAQHIIETTENDSEGKMQHSYVYKYDSLNRKTEYQSRSFNGSKYTNYNELFKYDEKGHLTESSHYELSGNLIYKDLYDFDKAGNQIKRTHYYNNAITTVTEDIFDNLGLLTTELEYRSGALELKKVFKYDATGNVIKITHSDAKGAVKTEFDYKISYY